MTNDKSIITRRRTFNGFLTAFRYNAFNNKTSSISVTNNEIFLRTIRSTLCRQIFKARGGRISFFLGNGNLRYKGIYHLRIRVLTYFTYAYVTKDGV